MELMNVLVIQTWKLKSAWNVSKHFHFFTSIKRIENESFIDFYALKWDELQSLSQCSS